MAKSIKKLNAEFDQRVDRFLRSDPVERRVQLRDARVAEEKAQNGRLVLDVRVWISFLPILISLQLLAFNLHVTSWAVVGIVVGMSVVLLIGTTVTLLTHRTKGVAEKVWRQTLEDLIDAPRLGRNEGRLKFRRRAIA